MSWAKSVVAVVAAALSGWGPTRVLRQSSSHLSKRAAAWAIWSSAVWETWLSTRSSWRGGFCVLRLGAGRGQQFCPRLEPVVAVGRWQLGGSGFGCLGDADQPIESQARLVRRRLLRRRLRRHATPTSADGRMTRGSFRRELVGRGPGASAAAGPSCCRSRRRRTIGRQFRSDWGSCGAPRVTCHCDGSSWRTTAGRPSSSTETSD